MTAAGVYFVFLSSSSLRMVISVTGLPPEDSNSISVFSLPELEREHIIEMPGRPVRMVVHDGHLFVVRNRAPALDVPRLSGYSTVAASGPAPSPMASVSAHRDAMLQSPPTAKARRPSSTL
jgi:hypothetical protein